MSKVQDKYFDYVRKKYVTIIAWSIRTCSSHKIIQPVFVLLNRFHTKRKYWISGFETFTWKSTVVLLEANYGTEGARIKSQHPPGSPDARCGTDPGTISPVANRGRAGVALVHGGHFCLHKIPTMNLSQKMTLSQFKSMCHFQYH